MAGLKSFVETDGGTEQLTEQLNKSLLPLLPNLQITSVNALSG